MFLSPCETDYSGLVDLVMDSLMALRWESAINIMFKVLVEFWKLHNHMWALIFKPASSFSHGTLDKEFCVLPRPCLDVSRFTPWYLCQLVQHVTSGYIVMFKESASEAQIEQYKERLQAQGKYLAFQLLFDDWGHPDPVYARRKHLRRLWTIIESGSTNICPVVSWRIFV